MSDDYVVIVSPLRRKGHSFMILFHFDYFLIFSQVVEN